MALSRSPKRRVPKEFLQPRPMSGPAAQRGSLWRWLQLRWVHVGVGVLLSYALSWTIADDLWFNALLRASVNPQAAQRVALLSVAPSSVSTGHCAASIAQALTQSEAHSGLLLEPLAALCPPSNAAELDQEHAPPLGSVSERLFPRGPAIWTLDPSQVTPLLHTLGVPRTPWVRLRDSAAVPTTALERLQAGDVDKSLLSGRTVVVTLADSTGQVSAEARRQAATLSAAMELQPLQRLATPWLLLASFAGCTALSFSRKKLSQYPRVKLLVLFALGLCLMGAAALGLQLNLLLPLPSLGAGLLACWAVADLPRYAQARRADRHAEQLIRKASRLLQLRAPEYLDDSEFWQSLARKASNAHPADNVLVAELPPFSWRLKMWANGDLDESIIRERRRDIRRTPYSNLQGVPVASIVNDYLVMKGVPTVMVPILHASEVEGYVLLIGQSAADFFAENPLAAQELAQDLGVLIKNRRTLLQQDNAVRGQNAEDQPQSAAEEMLEGARAALTELQLMTALVQGAPCGLSYADPFGDVRILGKPWLKWLPQLSAELPTLTTYSTLRAGQLPLRELLHALTRQVGKPAPLLSNLGAAGYTLDVPAARAEGEAPMTLRLRVVRLEENQENPVGGFLASLTELPMRSDTSTSASRTAMVAVGGDPLVVFSLSRMLQRMVSTVGGGALVRLQTPREPAHVVGHRAELKEALETFLTNASSQATKGNGPVVSIKEHADRVELRVLDLKLGVPSAALQRAVQAPSVPPPGLNQLGTLVRAVENSHGKVELRTDGSWGAELELSLIRARPRIESAEAILQHLKVSHRPLRI